MAILQVFVEQVIKEDRLETFGQRLEASRRFFLQRNLRFYSSGLFV